MGKYHNFLSTGDPFLFIHLVPSLIAPPSLLQLVVNQMFRIGHRGTTVEMLPPSDSSVGEAAMAPTQLAIQVQRETLIRLSTPRGSLDSSDPDWNVCYVDREPAGPAKHGRMSFIACVYSL